MRWNSNCPPERANGRYPSSSSTIRSSRDSCAARVPPLPIRVSSSRRVTNQIAEIVESTQIALKGRVRLSNDFVDLRFVSYFGPVVRSDETHTTDQQQDRKSTRLNSSH